MSFFQNSLHISHYQLSAWHRRKFQRSLKSTYSYTTVRIVHQQTDLFTHKTKTMISEKETRMTHSIIQN